jgi:hypothetical protein
MSFRALILLLLVSVAAGVITYGFVYLFAPKEGPGMGSGRGLLIYNWIPIIIVPVTFLLGVLAYTALFPNIERRSQTGAGSSEKQQSTAAVLKVLKEDERRVVELLLNANGKMLQRDISRKTGFTRVKTHRILYRLVSRGIVTAKKYYNTYEIILADWIFPKE